MKPSCNGGTLSNTLNQIRSYVNLSLRIILFVYLFKFKRGEKFLNNFREEINESGLCWESLVPIRKKVLENRLNGNYKETI